MLLATMLFSQPRPVCALPRARAAIASNVAAHHELMALWDAAFPGRVLHLHYAHMVADQAGPALTAV